MTKNIIYIIIGLLVIGAVWFSFFQKTEKQPAEKNGADNKYANATMVKNGQYKISVPESVSNWEGKKTLIKDYTDRGTIKVKEGAVSVSEGIIMGTIVFDMTTIQTDSTGKGNGESGLDRHLKSEDFFAVETFPNATFVVKSAQINASSVNPFGYLVTGDLTMKDVTNEIEFPADIFVQDGMLKINGTVSIDRTKWNIRYGSDKFFDNLANNVIDDFFNMSFSLIAK